MASEKKMIFLRGSPCGRTGARKSLEGKRRESSAQGWVGEQQTVVALKWSGAKLGERRVTQGRRLSTFIVRSLPAHHRVSHGGSGWYGGGSGSARTGGRGKRWCGGVAFLGASVPRARPDDRNTVETSEVRASERCAGELARAPARTEAVGRDLARWTRSTARPSEVRRGNERRGGVGVGVGVAESEPSSPSLRSPSHTVRQPFTRARASRGRRGCSQGYGDRQREKRAPARNVGCGAGVVLRGWGWG